MQPSPEVILDATALLVLVNNELGAEVVGPMLPQAFISAISFGEVVQRLRTGGMPAKAVTAALSPLLAHKPVPFDEQMAYVAASVHERTQGHALGFGDCACLALAVTRKAPVVTTEAAWQHLGVDVKVILIGARPTEPIASAPTEQPPVEIPYEPLNDGMKWKIE